MGRNSIFSFTLQRKKNHDKESNTAERTSECLNYATTPSIPGLSKAEQILGEVVSIRHLPLPAQLESNTSLTSKPSYPSLTPSVGSSLIRDNLLPLEEETAAELRPNLSTKPSSTLLGSNFAQPTGLQSVRSASVTAVGRNVTLQSFYDPHQSSPHVSQQTSASSARDRALRKGLPTITQDLVHASPESEPSTREELSGELKRVRKLALKRKPAALDMSKLFPKPSATAANLLSPNKLVKSPSMLSETSEYFHSGFEKTIVPPQRFESDRMGSRISQGPPISHASMQRLSQYKPRNNHKMHVRKPPGGIQNWFDGLVEADAEDLELERSDQTLLDLAAERARDTRRVASGPLRRHPVEANDLYVDQRARVAAARCIPTPVLQQYAKDRRLSVMSTHSALSRRTGNSQRSKASRFADSGFRDLSVLSLSEDSQSDEEPPALSEGPSLSDTYGPEDLVATLEAHHTSERLEHSRYSEEGMEHASAEAEWVGPSPPALYHDLEFQVPVPVEVVKHGERKEIWKRKQRPGNEQTCTLSVTSEPDFTVQPTLLDKTSARPSSPSSDPEARLHTAPARMMTVTKEEELLLEMMRSKRASMKLQLFAEGYEEALRHERRVEKYIHNDEQPYLDSPTAESFPTPPNSGRPSMLPSPPADEQHGSSPRSSIRPRTSRTVVPWIEPSNSPLLQESPSDDQGYGGDRANKWPRQPPLQPHLLSPVSTCPPLTNTILSSQSSITSAPLCPPPTSVTTSTPKARPNRPVQHKTHSSNSILSVDSSDGGVRIYEDVAAIDRICEDADTNTQTKSQDKHKSRNDSIIVLDGYIVGDETDRGTKVARPRYHNRLDSVKEDILGAWAELGGMAGVQYTGLRTFY